MWLFKDLRFADFRYVMAENLTCPFAFIKVPIRIDKLCRKKVCTYEMVGERDLLISSFSIVHLPVHLPWKYNELDLSEEIYAPYVCTCVQWSHHKWRIDVYIQLKFMYKVYVTLLFLCHEIYLVLETSWVKYMNDN